MKSFFKILLLCFGLFFIFRGKIPSNLLDLISNDLSRDKVTKILAETYPKESILRKLDNKYGFDADAGANAGVGVVKRGQIDKLKEFGFINTTIATRNDRYFGLQYEYDVVFTSKLSPYIIEEINDINSWGYRPPTKIIKVKIAENVFNEISGIRKEGDNQYLVEFSTKIVTNPLAEILPLEQNEDGVGKGVVRFVRYDDGWRYGKLY
jgi:hypothetical protein